VLWRVDRGQDHSTQLFISSPLPPDLTHLVEQAGWPTTHTWDTRDYRPLLDRLVEGQRWAFRLTANPVRHVRIDDSDAQTKPHGHVTADQQLGWLLSRTEALGIDVYFKSDGAPTVLVRDRRTIRFGRNGSTVTLVTATYEGIVHIADAERLRQALVNGIGRAKGYGCGMLTLAPA
jgi:CRISPR system Cascade subunit CasE